MDDYAKFRREEMRRAKDYEEKEWRRLNIRRKSDKAMVAIAITALALLSSLLALWNLAHVLGWRMNG